MERDRINNPPPPSNYAGRMSMGAGDSANSAQSNASPNEIPASSGMMGAGGEGGGNQKVSEPDNLFVCNVCLDPVKDPVVTQCGHLYCWACLFRWLNTHHNTCPVCKAGISRDNVIPIFIEGNEQDPRYKSAGGSGERGEIPNRPLGNRPEALSGVNVNGENTLMNGVSATGNSGFFPSLFGLQFQNFIPANVPGNRALTPEEQQQEHLTRVLIALGSIVFVAFLLF